MRRRLTTLAAILALALTMAFASGAMAQQSPTQTPNSAVSTVSSTGNSAVSTTTSAVDNTADTVDTKTKNTGRWGLLGLLGLAGLAGLLKRPTRTVVEPVATRVTDVRTDVTTDRR